MFEGKEGQKLSFRSEILENAVDDADAVLNDLVRTMMEKGQSEGELTFKIHVSLEDVFVGVEAVKSPLFRHDVSSVLKITSKLNGESGLETSVAWDDELDGIVLRRLIDGQTSVYDNYEYEDAEE